MFLAKTKKKGGMGSKIKQPQWCYEAISFRVRRTPIPTTVDASRMYVIVPYTYDSCSMYGCTYGSICNFNFDRAHEIEIFVCDPSQRTWRVRSRPALALRSTPACWTARAVSPRTGGWPTRTPPALEKEENTKKRNLDITSGCCFAKSRNGAKGCAWLRKRFCSS